MSASRLGRAVRGDAMWPLVRGAARGLDDGDARPARPALSGNRRLPEYLDAADLVAAVAVLAGEPGPAQLQAGAGDDRVRVFLAAAGQTRVDDHRPVRVRGRP